VVVNSDSDILRVGGVVEKMFQGGTERYTVVDYQRGAADLLVVDVSKGEAAPIVFPVSAVFSGEIVPVPEVGTPKFPDDVAKLLLAELHNIIKACSRCASISSGDLVSRYG
jgi:hypothetical protein